MLASALRVPTNDGEPCMLVSHPDEVSEEMYDRANRRIDRMDAQCGGRYVQALSALGQAAVRRIILKVTAPDA